MSAVERLNMCEEETEPWQMQFRHNKTEMSKTRINQGNPVTHYYLQLASRGKRYFCWGLWGSRGRLREYSLQSASRTVPWGFACWSLRSLCSNSFGKKYYSYFLFPSLPNKILVAHCFSPCDARGFPFTALHVQCCSLILLLTHPTYVPLVAGAVPLALGFQYLNFFSLYSLFAIPVLGTKQFSR